MSLKPPFRVKPKFEGRKVFHSFDLEKIIPNLNMDLLIVRFFGVFKSNFEKYNETIKEVELMLDEIKKNSYITTKGIYGIFRVKSEKNYILVKAEDREYQIPLNIGKDGISISDFLYEDDFVGFISTSSFIDENLFFRNISKENLRKVFIINSINIMLAEAFTEVLHYLIIEDMGLENKNEMKELYKNKNIGKRYSPGYPGLDISVNKTIHELLNAKEIGSRITESYMIDPESSVQSMVIYNPKAFYLK